MFKPFVATMAAAPCPAARFRVPFAVTANWSTHNLHFLETHDFLRRTENVVQLRLDAPAYSEVVGPH